MPEYLLYDNDTEKVVDFISANSNKDLEKKVLTAIKECCALCEDDSKERFELWVRSDIEVVKSEITLQFPKSK